MELKTRYAIIMVLFILLLVFSPTHVQAQNQVRFSVLEIDLWPEYDQPAMLVINKIQLAPETTLPVELMLRIPVEAGEPSAVAVGESEDNLINSNYKRDVQGKWANIRITTALPVIRLEYYDPRIVKQDAARHYEFAWVGDYEVDDFLVQVQQPFGVSSMVISPDKDEFLSSSDGTLTYYDTQVGLLKAGSSYYLTIEYEKSSDVLSVDGLKVEPIVPVTKNTSGRVAWLSSPVVIVLMFGLVIVIGGGIWYSRSQNRMVSVPTRGRRKTSKIPAEAKANADQPVIYCHQCGKRANNDDRFCRVCGARLRVEGS